ncbi:uncharacterized protein LOC142232171 [Haematobia irritans]|uniref:uncharacterized protein LOC142232171 n=1 Tax=Haematobia irritans TaxID=7368 RepID=UPI003F5004C8
MLKNCFLPTNYNNISCGEIVYQNFDAFIFNCKLCKIKEFNFEDFLIHLKYVHEEELNKKKYYDGTMVTFQDQEEYNKCDFVHILNSVKKRNEASHEDVKFDDSDDVDQECRATESDLENPEESKCIIKKPRKPKEYSCEICNKKYADEKRLNMHVKMVHLKKKTHKCEHCQETFSSAASLQKHIGKQHIGFECPTCSKRFSSGRGLRRHMLLHIEVKEYICSFENCGKQFATPGLLKDHQRWHAGPLLVCEVCGYSCKQRDSLIVHKRHHSGEKPFSCKICDARFASKPLLKEHMAAHETQRNHVCDVCGKRFNRPKALYHHKHLHLGIKKFVCKICGLAFAQASGLSAHMRKHREETTGTFTSVIGNNESLGANAF